MLKLQYLSVPAEGDNVFKSNIKTVMDELLMKHVNTYQPRSLILRGIEGAWIVLHSYFGQFNLLALNKLSPSTGTTI